MSTIESLLDAAKAKTGSDNKTAALLGVPFQQISDWRGARKNPQPEDHALVAALAGLDAEEALVRAVLEKHANKPKGERLLSVLGNVLHRTGAAAISLSSASVASATSRVAKAIGDNVHRVVSVATIWRMSNKLT